ncbi:MAG: hypothetical protein NTX85_00710 [Candidatus Nomurabacteria bacterium]|nr:hypothetical protein [Candidatus Nomurabacteria bacterium]
MDEQNIANQKIRQLHTYESDMADAVREQEGTVIKIALAEKARRENEEIVVETKKAFSMNIFYVIGGIFLVALAIWGTIFLIQKGKEASQVSQPKIQIETLVHGDSQTLLDVTAITNKNDMATAIINASKGEVKNNKIASIIPITTVNGVSQIMDTPTFLNLLGVNMPGALSRSLDNSFMIGVYNNNAKNHLFIILKTNDYNQSFAGMLSWESNILSDMFTLFQTDVSIGSQSIFETPWSDKIIENKDSRVLRDENGKELLTYMFLGKDKLVITDDQDSIREILVRLVTQNIKPL